MRTRLSEATLYIHKRIPRGTEKLERDLGNVQLAYHDFKTQSLEPEEQ